MEDSSRSSFFTTERGQLAVVHALARAKAHIAASSRTIEISFSGVFEELFNITVDDEVTLSDSRIPGNKIRGKVIKTGIFINNNKKFVTLRIACCVGNNEIIKNELTQVLITSIYVENGFFQENVIQKNANEINFDGIKIADFSNQLPKEGILVPQSMNVGNFIKGIEIINSAEEQENIINKSQVNSKKELIEVLLKNQTQLRIHLIPLKSKSVLEHVITPKILTSWSAPKDVDLQAQG